MFIRDMEYGGGSGNIIEPYLAEIDTENKTDIPDEIYYKQKVKELCPSAFLKTHNGRFYTYEVRKRHLLFFSKNIIQELPSTCSSFMFKDQAWEYAYKCLLLDRKYIDDTCKEYKINVDNPFLW